MAFTFFFRDAETLELAIEQILPVVQGQDRIDIWDAGCAHGPEPYTLAILLRERMSAEQFCRVQIHASDVDCGFAAPVTDGIFPESQLRRLPDGIRDKYFQPLAALDSYGITEEIRSKICFVHHDLLSLEPVGKNFSFIVCKNVLLHFNEEQRCKVLQMFHDALRAEGVLVMEQTQKIPRSLPALFRPLVCHAQVFGKVKNLSKTVSRTDPSANNRRPNLWKNVLCRKSESDQLEKGGNGTV